MTKPAPMTEKTEATLSAVSIAYASLAGNGGGEDMADGCMALHRNGRSDNSKPVGEYAGEESVTTLRLTGGTLCLVTLLTPFLALWDLLVRGRVQTSPARAGTLAEQLALRKRANPLRRNKRPESSATRGS